VLKYLLDQVDIDKDGYQRCLSSAAYNGDLELVKYLVEKNENVYSYDKQFIIWPALMWAAEKEYDNIVDFLLKKGADIDLCLHLCDRESIYMLKQYKKKYI
jgi:ankyrin repeat protein